jgi:hypothetical protein
MRGITARAVRSAALVVAVALAIAALRPGIAVADEDRFTVIERATSDTIVDLGVPGDSPGDMLVFSNILYDAANEKPVGQDNGYCIRTVVGVSWECYFTSTLPKGQITVEGPFFDGQDSLLAITGGTDKFKAVTGEMRIVARNAEGTEYAFDFLIRY